MNIALLCAKWYHLIKYFYFQVLYQLIWHLFCQHSIDKLKLITNKFKKIFTILTICMSYSFHFIFKTTLSLNSIFNNYFLHLLFRKLSLNVIFSFLLPLGPLSHVFYYSYPSLFFYFYSVIKQILLGRRWVRKI